MPQPAIQPTVDITQVPAAAQPSAHFDADAATEAYMAMIPPAATARSNAYFEGGYWLILWDFLYASAICLLLLNLRWSARMRDLAERITRFKWLQDASSTGHSIMSVDLRAGLPARVLRGLRARAQIWPGHAELWPMDGRRGQGSAVNLVLGGLAAVAAVRHCAQAAHTPGGSGARLPPWPSLVIAVAIGPVYLQPIFNKVTLLNDPEDHRADSHMAHANGIPTNDVYQIDASRQTTRMSANVSGFANTMRITLNDNLLERGSPEEIQAVMGHEMGHYVMNHIPKFLFFLAVVISVSFAYLYWGLIGRSSAGERAGRFAR